MSFWDGFCDRVPMLRRWSDIEISAHRQEKINAIKDDMAAAMEEHAEAFKPLPPTHPLEIPDYYIDLAGTPSFKDQHLGRMFDAAFKKAEEIKIKERKERLKTPRTIYKKRKPTYQKSASSI